MQAPAQLNVRDYFVDELIVRTNLAFERKEIPSVETDIDFDIRRNEANPLEFMIPMTIRLNGEEHDFLSGEYQVLIKLTGFFYFIEGSDEETINRLIGPNGLSMLYGIARGVVAQTTANCWHGKLVLPSLNLMEIMKEKARIQEVTADSTGKKSKRTAAVTKKPAKS